MGEEQYVGKYRIEERLGSGTFATVYRCYDPDLETTCAVKVLSENWSEDESARNWFLNEARVMFGIEHPSILRIFTTGTLEDDRPFFVMEYADKGSLAQRIRERRAREEVFGVREALDISIAIADGLNVAHSRELVHRDLKPSNILFRSTPDGTTQDDPTSPSGPQIKLADFGLARRLEEGANSLAGAGTPHYIAPEQARGLADDRPDVRNDVYSAATILYELLAGQVPFPYQSMAQVIAAHLDEEPTPLQELAPHVPDEVAALVHAGLAKDPHDRIPNATAWKQQLQVLRTALNPDGSISGWAAAGAAAMDSGADAASEDPETLADTRTVPIEELAETRLQNKIDDDSATVAAAPAVEPSSEHSKPMVAYVIAAVALGLLVVGVLGVALADMVTGSNGGGTDDTELAVNLPEDDGEQVDPSPTPNVASDDSDDNGATAETTPTPEPTPTATPEATPSPTAEPTPEPADPVLEDIAEILEELPGAASATVVLPSGEAVDEGGANQVRAASAIKLWIAAAAYEEADNGDLDLDDTYTLTEADQAFGTGILNQQEYIGEELTIADLIETMLLYSDNTAANVVVDILGGPDRVNEYADDHGYESTQMGRMLGDVDADGENYTSGEDGALFLSRLVSSEIVDDNASRQLQSILEQRAATGDRDANSFGGELPDGVEFAHMPGFLPGARNEIGYFPAPDDDGFVIVSILLSELDDEGEGEAAIAAAIGQIYDLLESSDPG